MKKNNKKKLVIVTTLILLIVSCMVISANEGTAVTVEDIFRPFDVIKALLLAALSVVGVVFLVKNIFPLAISIQQQDSTGFANALLGVISGLMMAGAGIIMTLLGF